MSCGPISAGGCRAGHDTSVGPIIRTHRLLLRPVADVDAYAVAEGCSDPEIALYIPLIPSPYRLADAYAFIDASAEAWTAATEATFAILDARSEEFLGT